MRPISVDGGSLNEDLNFKQAHAKRDPILQQSQRWLCFRVKKIEQTGYTRTEVLSFRFTFWSVLISVLLMVFAYFL